MPDPNARTLLINADGTITFVYCDDLAGLLDAGQASIKRASHVEPTADNLWTADLTPSGGNVLGPFPLRSEALAAEVAWLENKLFNS